MQPISQFPPLADLKDKCAVITGAGSGIGRSIALALADQGCRLLLNDRDGARLKQVGSELGSDCRFTLFTGSVAEETVVDAMLDEGERALGAIDILINSAGVSMNVPTLELDLADWQRALDVNLTAAFLCSRGAARRMVQQGRGVIVNIASMYGLVASPERLAYCVSKSGLVMMTKAMAIEWASRGVRVNAVAPGYVQTPFLDELVARGRVDRDKLLRRTPQGRLAQPSEIANACIYLSSDLAGHITGETLSIDGGWTAYGYI